MTRSAWLILLFALSIGATLYWGDYKPKPIDLSGADLEYWSATYERTEEVVVITKSSPTPSTDPEPVPLANCDIITKEGIEKLATAQNLWNAAKYGKFGYQKGDESYWAEQQISVWYYRLILTTQKTILDLKLDSLKDVAERYDNLNPQGILMIEVQRWLANKDLQALIATVTEPCLCDSEAEATGGTVFRQVSLIGSKILSVKEGHVNQAISLAQAASLNRASFANEYDLFDAAEALELRCVPAHNLHLAYLRGDGDYILKEEKTEASRLARLIAMKAVMLAAETQAVTLTDVGNLAYAAQQVMQRSEAIKTYSGCR